MSTSSELEKLRSTVDEIKNIVQELKADFNTGDIVATPNGTGVVAAEMESSFEFPDDDGTKTISVGDDETMYIVGFVEEMGVYRSEALESTSLEDEGRTDGEAVAFLNGEAVGDIPDNWDEESLLDFWSSVGGTFSEAVNELEDSRDISESQAQQIAANYKDRLLGTEEWRNRF